MAIMITGGAGYIGSQMAWFCHDNKIPYIVLDDLSTGSTNYLPPNVILIIGDVADERLLSKIFKKYSITEIIHFAAKISVYDSVINPLNYYRNNLAKTSILLDCAIKNGVTNFIFSSTAAVYGNALDEVVKEDTPKNPVSPYGQSKLMVEKILADCFSAYGLNYAVLRYFNVAGADPYGRTGQTVSHSQQLIKAACQAALGIKSNIQIFGNTYETPDGTCIRDYIHVWDLVWLHSKALKYLHQKGGPLIINCGYGIGYSVKEIISAVKNISGSDFPVTISDKREGDPPALVADTAFVNSILDWVPKYNNIEFIVRHTLDWEKTSLNQRNEL